METTIDFLGIGIGHKEAEGIKPARVKIQSVSIEEVGAKKSKKLVCVCVYPGRSEPLKISSVKYEKKGKLDVNGLWLNLDEDKLIRKGSALAMFMQYSGAGSIEAINGKELDTVLDDKGFLCFKAY